MEDSSLPLSVSNDFEDCTNLENDDLDEYLEDSEGTGEESDGLGEDMEDSKSTGEEIDDLDEDMEDSKGTGEENDDLDEHMEDTKGTEEEEGLYDCALFNGKPYKELTEDDLHGVSFKTIAEVESFYSYYSLAMGFSVRRNKLDWNASGTIVTRRSLVCSRQGTRRESGKARPVVNEVEGLKRRCVDNQHKKSVVNDCQHTPKRKKQRTPQKGRLNGRTQTRRLTRGNCPAGLTVTWCSKRRAYYASQFVTEHNHSLARMEHLQFLNSHRHVKGHALAQVTSLKKVSVPTCRAYELLVHQAGGHEYVGFTLKDLYNKLKAEKDSILLDGDAQASVTFMNMSALQDPHFYCVYSADENGRLANMFWRDGQSLSDYTNFGDVLIFDSTYRSNIYDKPLAVFVGLNNHRGTVLFGCALLVDETEETYNWVLNAFLTSMHGKKPVSVITDGDDAMRNAVSSLLPEARHRLCAWHIGKNVCQHLKDEDTRKEFFHLIFGGFTIEEWESAWQYFVAMNGLENDPWVSSMYNKRERWAEAFFRDHFFAGVCSTQRCEGMHRNLKGGIGRYMRLCEMMPRMLKSVQRIRNRALEDDFRSEQSEPVLDTHLKCLEKQIGKIFTHDIFLLIKDQINYENKFVIAHREVDLHNTYQSISVTQFGKPERRWNVFYQPDESNPRFVCSCKLFESDGIPCCHIFLVMKCEMITNFPDSLVNPRWKKDAGQKKISIPNGSADDKSMRIARYGELMGICSRLCHLASYSEEGYDETRGALRQLTLKSEKFKAVTADPVDAVTFEGPHPNVIRDPVVCKTKGVQSKASIPGNEENYKSKVGKECKLCKMPGHNQRTCHKLKNDKGKQATQKNRGKGCGKQVAENMSERKVPSIPGKQATNRPKRKVPNLIHNMEEARPLEFFTGYEKSDDLETGSTSSRLPDFFEHFRPFPSA